MGFDDQSVEPEVHGLLRERGDQFAFAPDVAGVAEDRQGRQAAVQLDGHGPQRVVAVEVLVDRRKAAVDGPDAADAGVVDTLDGADPQFEVGAHGVLHQHRDVRSAQGVGDLLHGEGIGRRAGPDPEQVDTAFQRCGDVFAGGDFGGGVHARFTLHALQPCDARRTYALESSRLGAGFPQPGAVDVKALCGQRTGRFHDLFFGFGAAGTCDDQRPPGIDPGECDGLNVVHDELIL